MCRYADIKAMEEGRRKEGIKERRKRNVSILYDTCTVHF
jgi:hypothetical protein